MGAKYDNVLISEFIYVRCAFHEAGQEIEPRIELHPPYICLQKYHNRKRSGKKLNHYIKSSH